MKDEIIKNNHQLELIYDKNKKVTEYMLGNGIRYKSKMNGTKI